MKAFSNHRLMLIDLSLNYLSLYVIRDLGKPEGITFFEEKELKICNEVNKGDIAWS